MRVWGKAGWGGPEGRGTRGARRSWRVAIFEASFEFLRVEGAMSNGWVCLLLRSWGGFWELWRGFLATSEGWVEMVVVG